MFGKNPDLPKEILKWLPPEDKMSLSGVSRAFDRDLGELRSQQKTLQIETITSVRFLDKFPESQTIILRNEIHVGMGFPVPLYWDLKQLILNFPNVKTVIFDFHSLVEHNTTACPLDALHSWRKLESVKTTWGSNWLRVFGKCDECDQIRNRKRKDSRAPYLEYR
jgi:hypothetical protein